MLDTEEHEKINMGLLRVYCLLFILSLTTIVISIISSESRPQFEMRLRQQQGLVICTNDMSAQGLECRQQAVKGDTKQIKDGAIVKEYALRAPRKSAVEGLEFTDGEMSLLMSTGSYGGYLNVFQLSETGDEWVLQSHSAVSPEFFGMGVTTVGEEVFMLTWKARKLLLYKLKDLLQDAGHALDPILKDLPESMQQGWGLSHDSQGLLYISDGGSEIRVLDPQTGLVLNTIFVSYHREPVYNLNELEVVGDKWIFANQYTENNLFQIEIETGNVVKKWDLSALQQRQKQLVLDKNDVWNGLDDKNDVLNGVAYRASTDTFFMTGSMWDLITEIRLDYRRH